MTISDIRIDPLVTERFGVQMVWRSVAHGVIAEFPWWDHLERNPRLDDPEWWPVGTESDHFLDADQNWVFESWADEQFVYVRSGTDISSVDHGFRVPRQIFRAAWLDGVRRIKSEQTTADAELGGYSRP